MAKVKNRIIIVFLTMITVTAASGCSVPREADEVTDSTMYETLYFTEQPVRESPEWVTELDAAKETDQLIVVAGIDKTTAYVTMHERDKDGKWKQIIATPGFIGKDGLGDANINDALYSDRNIHN